MYQEEESQQMSAAPSKHTGHSDDEAPKPATIAAS
jgi:hypothetical protein